MGPIELVVFDLAGTTVEDDGAVLSCLVEATTRHGLPGSPEELNALMGMNKREVFQLLAERTGARPTGDADRLADEALASFVSCMSASYERSLSPVPGAEEAFVFLHERGIGVAIDTGFDATIAGLIMTRLRWPERLVDVVVSSSDVPRGRPAPYMIFRAMERLGVLDVRRVMKIGDSPSDLEEGTNAGCGEVIGVLSGAHDAESLGKHPHTRLLPSVAALPALFG